MASPTQVRQSRLARRFLAATFIFFALIIAAFLFWRVNLHARLQSQLAAIHKAGLPTSGAELNDYLPEIPPSENGAPALSQAFTNLHGLRIGTNTIPGITEIKPSDSWPAETRALLDQHLVTNQQAFAEIESVLKRYSQFRFPVDFSFGASAEIPHLTYFKRAAQAYRVQAMLLSDTNNPSWTNSILTQLKLARVLESEPHTIAFLVRVAVLRIAQSSAQFALNRAQPDPAACRLLQDAFLGAAATNLLPQTLISERALYAPYFRMSRAEYEKLAPRNEDEDSADQSPRPTRQPSGTGLTPLWATGFFERDLAFYLRTIDEAITISRSGAPANLQLTNTFNVTIAKRRLYIWSGSFLPALSRLTIHSAEAEASAKLSGTAFAVEAFHHANKRVPENLQELIPDFLQAIPIDPFDGKPIRYRKLPTGYVLYSVDIDLKDDAGKPGPARRNIRKPITYDLTFNVDHTLRRK